MLGSRIPAFRRHLNEAVNAFSLQDEQQCKYLYAIKIQALYFMPSLNIQCKTLFDGFFLQETCM